MFNAIFSIPLYIISRTECKYKKKTALLIKCTLCFYVFYWVQHFGSLLLFLKLNLFDLQLFWNEAVLLQLHIHNIIEWVFKERCSDLALLPHHKKVLCLNPPAVWGLLCWVYMCASLLSGYSGFRPQSKDCLVIWWFEIHRRFCWLSVFLCKPWDGLATCPGWDRLRMPCVLSCPKTTVFFFPEYQIVFAVLLALLLRLHNLCVVYFARISSKLSTEWSTSMKMWKSSCELTSKLQGKIHISLCNCLCLHFHWNKRMSLTVI